MHHSATIAAADLAWAADRQETLPSFARLGRARRPSPHKHNQKQKAASFRWRL